jgi:hypothetical protein
MTPESIKKTNILTFYFRSQVVYSSQSPLRYFKSKAMIGRGDLAYSGAA